MRRLRTNRIILAAAAVLVGIGVILFLASAYAVREDEYAVVLRFGEPVAVRTEPGLYFCTPFAEGVTRLPKRIQGWEGRREQRTTLDKKLIFVIPWARWRITDPEAFLRVVRNIENAQQKLDTIIDGAVGEVIAQHRLIDVVRSTNEPLREAKEEDELQRLLRESDEDRTPERPPGTAPDAPSPDQQRLRGVDEPEWVKVGLEKLVKEICRKADERLRRPAKEGEGETGAYGFEIVAVGLKRQIYVPKELAGVYERMRKERKRWATAYRTTGERLKQGIINQAKADAERLRGEGERQAAITKGEAEAFRFDQWGKTIRENQRFYDFVRQLEAYQKTLEGRPWLVISLRKLFDPFGLRWLTERQPGRPVPSTQPAPEPQ